MSDSRETSIICRECDLLVGGVEAGNSVRWVICPDCLPSVHTERRLYRADPFTHPWRFRWQRFAARFRWCSIHALRRRFHA